jgi:hypothetical protein
MKTKRLLAAIIAAAAALTMSMAVSAAPVTEDDELIDEPMTTEPVDPADEPTEVLPEEPVAPVENPTTGNSPIALAVVPVALAAAAVVAKKVRK